MSEGSVLRRKQLFSFTLTELFLLILFILLLLLWYITKKAEEARNDLILFQEKTGFSQAKELPENWTRLAPALKEANNKLEEFEKKTGFNNPSDLPNLSDDIVKTIDHLKKDIESLEEKLEENRGRIKILTQGQGIPPCWIKGWPDNPQTNKKGYDKKEFIFTAKLRNNGIILEKDIPNTSDYNNQYKILPIDKIKFNKILNKEEFTIQTNEIFLLSEKDLGESNSNLTLKRQCRHYIRVFDETSSNQKEIYKSLLKTIENQFYIYEYDDTYIEYKNNKNG